MKQYPDALTIRRAVRISQAEDAALKTLKRTLGGGNPLSYLLRLAIVEFIRNHRDPQTTNDTRASMHETTKSDR